MQSTSDSTAFQLKKRRVVCCSLGCGGHEVPHGVNFELSSAELGPVTIASGFGARHGAEFSQI
jgi:hypothetical protein